MSSRHDVRAPSASGGPRGETRPRPSARSLLLTVLGEWVLPRERPVWSGSLIAALRLLGTQEKAARQALVRIAAAGWLQGQRQGRRVRWQLTPAGRELLRTGADRIYAFVPAREAWDGRWLVLLTSVPEARRDARHVLRTRLAWAGFGSLGQGVWLSPDVQREAEAQRILAALGPPARAYSLEARFGAIGEERELAAQAWDMAELNARYAQFTTEFRQSQAETDADCFVAQARLVHAWRKFPFIDPGLPRRLLPAEWAGTAAWQLFLALHERWQAPASRWWEQASSAR